MTKNEQEYDRIIADCTETLNASPDDIIALIKRGRAWYEKRHYTNAIADFDLVLSRNADRADVRNQRGLAFSKNGEHDLAITDFTEAILHSPTQEYLPHLYYNRGRCRRLTGAYDDAFEDLTKTIRLDPQNANAYLTRGLVWQDLCDYRKAIADYNLAIRYHPKSADAYHNRGNAWVYLGKLRKGIADFTQAIQVDPKSVKIALTHTSRGVAWRRKGRYSNALADYERALELEPDSVVRRACLAEFLATCPDDRYRNGARALQLATEACELTKYSNIDYLGCLAAANAEQGNFDSAIFFQKKALNLAGDNDAKEDMQSYIDCYTTAVPCRMEPPSWQQRWA